jgi:hypothetical protein
VLSQHCSGPGLLENSVFLLELVSYSRMCIFSNCRSAQDQGKWCGPLGQSAWTVRQIQNQTLLGHSPPASQAGRRVGPALWLSTSLVESKKSGHIRSSQSWKITPSRILTTVHASICGKGYHYYHYYHYFLSCRVRTWPEYEWVTSTSYV